MECGVLRVLRIFSHSSVRVGGIAKAGGAKVARLAAVGYLRDCAVGRGEACAIGPDWVGCLVA